MDCSEAAPLLVFVLFVIITCICLGAGFGITFGRDLHEWSIRRDPREEEDLPYDD